jgi:aryl-alcohol dehydrogenase-like predicted oxidoreductase
VGAIGHRAQTTVVDMTQPQRHIGDLSVSAIGLGGMKMSLKRPFDEEESIATVHAALDAGVTLIDTADVYNPDDGPFGHNEELVARALASYGDTGDVVVATKGGMTRDGADWGIDGNPARFRQAAQDSARRLGVDAIALYQLHRPDPDYPYAETMGAFKDLVDDGIVQQVGISNASCGQIREAREVLGDALASVQNEFNPGHLDSQPELDLCEELGLAFLPYSPLGGIQGASDLAAQHAPFVTVGERHGASAYQVALAWELARSPVVVPIPGASRPESIRDSAAAMELTLSEDDLALLP